MKLFIFPSRTLSHTTVSNRILHCIALHNLGAVRHESFSRSRSMLRASRISRSFHPTLNHPILPRIAGLRILICPKVSGTNQENNLFSAFSASVVKRSSKYPRKDGADPPKADKSAMIRRTSPLRFDSRGKPELNTLRPRGIERREFNGVKIP